MHFENLWEDAEKTLSDETNISSQEELIKEIEAKLTVYNLLCKASMPEQDLFRLKTHTLGKIILAITQLSAKDNINVFAALKVSLDEAKISVLENKYK